MNIVLGGMFESAFIRMNDEKAAPDRNSTGHPYYLDLNRNTDKIYRDGAATFVALAEAVPFSRALDWNRGEIAERCGLHPSDDTLDNTEANERYAAINAAVKAVSPCLSVRSKLHITQLDLRGYGDDIVERYGHKTPGDDAGILTAYVRRLVHQVLTAGESDSYLLLGEADIVLVAEIGAIILDSSCDLPFPDLRGKVIDPFALVEGVLNYSPRDIESVEVVRNDPDIRTYAKEISAEIDKSETSGVTEAAVKAYLHTEAGRNVQEVFEVSSWVVKPLHYVPGVDAIITAIEDVKDGVNSLVKWRMRYKDWHIIGVKMQTIATEDFFRRLSNKYPQLG